MGLEVEPELRRVAEESCQSKRSIRRDAALAPDDLADPRLVDVRPLREPVSRDAHRLEELLGEDFPGVDIRDSVHRSLLLVMVVRDLDVGRVTASPFETDPPLIVDRDAPLAFAVTRQRMKPVPRRDPEVFEADGRMEDEKPALGRAQDVGREPPGELSFPYPLGLLVPERHDHLTILLQYNSIVKQHHAGSGRGAANKGFPMPQQK